MVARVGTTSRTLTLDGDAWELSYAPRVDAPAPAYPADGADGYRTIPAVVPGSVELDLIRSGDLPDLFEGDHLREAWKLEYGDWWYRREFDLPEGWDPARTSLIFDGLDTIATIALNGAIVGSTANMMIAHELDVAAALRPGRNELVVHLRSPLAAAEEYPYPAQLSQIWDASESLWIRKPPHMYGWDIAPRLVSAGIFRSVRLVERAPERVEDWYFVTKRLDDRSATVELHYELSRAPRGRDVRLEVTGVHTPSGTRFSATAHPTFISGHLLFTIDDPHVWMPRGYGSPELYDVELTLTIDGVAADHHETRLGLRRIELDTKLAADDSGRFRVIVNGQPVILLGTNWVPLDALHARDEERLPRALELLAETGSNVVRAWGGNLYESDAFYDWCDANGVLVWQDFAFACARYPQTEPFLTAVAEEAEAVVRRLRNHASLMLWCGSNETDDSFADDGIDPWTDEITRVLLPRVARLHDWRTPYLPSSPVLTSDPSERLRVPEQHLWGARASFKDPFYVNTTAQFVSEIGYHGMPALSSLRRFLPTIPASEIPHDPLWRLHESHHREHPNWYYSRNGLLVDQAKLYLDGDPDVLEELVLSSQVSQAEAKKFFVEQARLARGRRWGLIWWNLIDGWPQLSDAVADYYGVRKLAFHYIVRSQQPVVMMAREAAGWRRDVVLANDTPGGADIEWRIRSASTGEELAAGAATLDPHTDRVVATLPVTAAGDCYLFTWQGAAHGRPLNGGNHYTEGAAPLSFTRYRDSYLPQIAALTPAFDPEASWR